MVYRLRLIDALEIIFNYQTKASFIQGFKLGYELTSELQTYNSQFDEINSRQTGSFFMSEEENENGQSKFT